MNQRPRCAFLKRTAEACDLDIAHKLSEVFLSITALKTRGAKSTDLRQFNNETENADDKGLSCFMQAMYENIFDPQYTGKFVTLYVWGHCTCESHPFMMSL